MRRSAPGSLSRGLVPSEFHARILAGQYPLGIPRQGRRASPGGTIVVVESNSPVLGSNGGGRPEGAPGRLHLVVGDGKPLIGPAGALNV